MAQRLGWVGHVALFGHYAAGVTDDLIPFDAAQAVSVKVVAA
jgi:hypothetical protein